MHPFIAGVQSNSIPRSVEVPSVDVVFSANSFSSMKRHNKEDAFTFNSGGRTVMPVDSHEDHPPSPHTEEVKSDSPPDLSASDPYHNVSGPFGNILPSVPAQPKQEEEVVVLRRDPNESCKSPDSYTNSNSSSSGNGSQPSNSTHNLFAVTQTVEVRSDSKTKGEGRSRANRTDVKQQTFSIVCAA